MTARLDTWNLHGCETPNWGTTGELKCIWTMNPYVPENVIFVPEGVLDVIKEHIRQSSLEGESAWRASPKNEDTITGHWGGKLAMPWSRPILADSKGWRYRVDYRKYCNRTEETPTGSNGVLQIEIGSAMGMTFPDDDGTSTTQIAVSRFRKGILFNRRKATKLSERD